MKSVSGGRAITRQAYQFSVFGFGGVAFGVFLIVLGAFLSRVPLAAPGSADAATLQTIVSIAQAVGVVAVILGIAAIARGLTFKRKSPLTERVAAVLSGALGDEYVLFRGLNTVRLGYIDAVLIGPPGVLVFRIVEGGGTLLVEGDRWLRPGRIGDWVPAGINATHECIVDMRAVRNHLARKNVPTEYIFGVAVIVGDARITEKASVLPSVTVEQLVSRLKAGYMAKQRIDPPTASAIIAQLNPG
ncbi:MAG: hypothetical protein IPM16_09590 [Chloroflexi bacterium]|nr:hypothetical protein [Chloroflexota bacterium]